MATKYAKYSTTGQITNADFMETSTIATQALLNDIGAWIVSEMKTHTQSSSSSGRLDDSISWKTALKGSGMGSAAKQSDALDAPTDGYTVVAGSGVPYAVYVNNGSLPHMTSEGSDKFLESLKEWCAREGLSEYYWAIVNSIRKHGTKAQPFVDPVIPKLPAYIRRQIGLLYKAERLFNGKAKR